jgi:hypothetical protein
MDRRWKSTLDDWAICCMSFVAVLYTDRTFNAQSLSGIEDIFHYGGSARYVPLVWSAYTSAPITHRSLSEKGVFNILIRDSLRLSSHRVWDSESWRLFKTVSTSGRPGPVGWRVSCAVVPRGRVLLGDATLCLPANRRPRRRRRRADDVVTAAGVPG